ADADEHFRNVEGSLSARWRGRDIAQRHCRCVAARGGDLPWSRSLLHKLICRSIPSMMLEPLHLALMFLRRLAVGERAEVFPMAMLIFLPRIQAILAAFEFANHKAPPDEFIFHQWAKGVNGEI